MAGLPELRQAIVDKVAALYGPRFDVESEVTVTAGATQAIFTAIAAFVRPGDEVIVFEPVYDSYVPAIETVGGKAVFAQLQFPDYAPDWAQVEALDFAENADDHRQFAAQPDRQPADCGRPGKTGRKWSVAPTSSILSDEVYEHILFDGEQHASLCGHAELAQRSIVVSSFGKTYHITGWKIGYVVGPAALMAEFRKVHQFNVFTVHAPSQLAIAEYMQDASRHLGLAAFYQEKRDFFRQLLAATPFELLPCRGTYFQLASYAGLSDLPDRQFAEWMTREVGVAVIPVSVFYADGRDDRVVRFLLRQAGGDLARRRRAPV